MVGKDRSVRSLLPRRNGGVRVHLRSGRSVLSAAGDKPDTIQLRMDRRNRVFPQIIKGNQ